ALVRTERQSPRDRERLHGGERQRRAIVDVVVLVELAQFALGLTRLGSQATRGALAAPQRRPREGDPPQQVIPVRVCGEQPRDWEPGMLEHARHRLELVGIYRRV